MIREEVNDILLWIPHNVSISRSTSYPPRNVSLRLGPFSRLPMNTQGGRCSIIFVDRQISRGEVGLGQRLSRVVVREGWVLLSVCELIGLGRDLVDEWRRRSAEESVIPHSS